MPLPERTLCWVEGPPWDRSCESVERPDGRVKIYGTVIDENRDEGGFYAVIDTSDV